MLKSKATALLLFFILLLGACNTNSTTSALSAALSELKGKVDMKAAGAGSFTPATANSVLEVNGQIQTGDDGRVRLDLSTGTIIRVAPSSMFTLTSNEEVDGGLATKLKLDIGKVFIILNGGNTEVETPSGVASVHGSYMSVWVDPVTHDVYVTCLEGHCSAENPAGNVDFTEGQQTILFHQKDDGTWTAPGAEDMTDEEFKDWLDNNPEAKKIFDDAMATLTAIASSNESAEPTNTPEPTPTLESALPAGDASNGCFQLLGHEPDKEPLDAQGKVTFKWGAQQGATHYILTFTDANGNKVSFDTKNTDTSLGLYVETYLTNPGEYSWDVTAYGGDGSAICTAEAASFSKPDSKVVPNKDRTGSDACDPMDCSGSCPNQYYCGG